MKKTTKLKAFVLSLMMVAMLPMTSFAQNDNFVTDFNNGVRDVDPITIWTANNGFQNDPFGAPLGSGLLILTAVGAGYAISRRKRNIKKGTTLLLAALMLLGMTNCRKSIVEPIAQPTGSDKVAITLNVGGGAKAEVNPPYVNFETGDKILVASDGHYVGTLTGTRVGDNVTFSGDITDPVVGEPLYFYFLGNKATGTLTPGTSGSTSCTVDISDQTSELPVISMGVSIDRSTGNTVTYPSANNEYEAQLHNKASLIKFNVTTSSNSPICLTGMYNTVTVSFDDLSTNDGFSYSHAGNIWMKGKDSENVTWAIVLPQADLTGAGEAYTKGYSGTWNTAAVDLAAANQYIIGDGSGITLTVNSEENSKTLDLSKVSKNETVADGWTIINTLIGKYKISIADGATVMLDGATINLKDNGNGADYAGLTCEGDATIILADGTTNTVVSGLNGSGENNWPGIYVPTGKTLTINGNTGILNARCGQDSYGGSAAGIGCGFSSGSDCGNIIINGGVINAGGGSQAAGIGGAYKRNCGSITINGGTVTAIGNIYGSASGYGAGIGSGGSLSSTAATITCGDITITGGTVTATGGGGAAGIGTGAVDKEVAITCGKITISGGTITATGGEDAAGIGTGQQFNGSKVNQCGDITITGGTVIATGTGDAAGIGTGDNNVSYTLRTKCGNITITSGVTRVTATKGSTGFNSIGEGGHNSTCGTITIGGVVTGNISESPYTYEP